jgi:hypothetical protein
MKFCIEYFSLFLDTQVPPVPTGVRSGCPGSEQWEAGLKVLTTMAWKAASDFWLQHCNAKKTKVMSTSIFTFKTLCRTLTIFCGPRVPVMRHHSSHHRCLNAHMGRPCVPPRRTIGQEEEAAVAGAPGGGASGAPGGGASACRCCNLNCIEIASKQPI